MTENTLQIFIDGAVHYFKQTSDTVVDVSAPFLEQNQKATAHDYTGIISISGPIRGCVYFTAPKILAKHLLLSMGEQDTSTENIIDLFGEVANTIAGNARSQFGSAFVISVPVVIEGQPSGIHLPDGLRSYVIPITWKSYRAAVVISLQ